MKTGFFLSFFLVILTACAPVLAASVYPIESINGVIDAVEIELDKASINLYGGGEFHVQGEAKINLPDLAPFFAEDGARLKIGQPMISNDLAPKKKSVINDWQIQLGQGPYDLSLLTESLAGEVDLSGIALSNIIIRERASTYSLMLSSPNPVELEKFSYFSKASNATLSGLGYLNTNKAVFESISGRYVLNFSGELQQDLDVDIRYALGSLTLEIPETTNARILLDGNYRSLNAKGSWNTNGTTVTNDVDGPLLTIHVEMDVGDLSLVLIP